jgi:hypothetical protein
MLLVLWLSYQHCMNCFNVSSILSSVVANIVIEEVSNVVVMNKDG